MLESERSMLRGLRDELSSARNRVLTSSSVADRLTQQLEDAQSAQSDAGKK
jgi:hypothetical protein